jgi:hypothetical protein
MSKAKTLDDALKGHDPDTIIRGKIEAQFAAMRAVGPEEWDEEPDFCSKAQKISLKTIVPYREVYKSHVAIAPPKGDRAAKVLWFADPKFASKFRDKTAKKTS